MPGEIMEWGGIEFKGDDMVENAKVEIPAVVTSNLDADEQEVWDNMILQLNPGALSTEEMITRAFAVIAARRRGTV